jgi:hypothetical protein
VRKAQYFRNKNFLLENRFGTGLQQVPDWSAAHVITSHHSQQSSQRPESSSRQSSFICF